MNISAALRHTLLRTLTSIHRDAIDSAIRREVTDSLNIDTDKDGIHLTWCRGGKKHSRNYPTYYFTFYLRGDRSSDAPVLDQTVINTNHEHAIEIVRELVGDPDLVVPVRLPLPSNENQPKTSITWWPLIVIIAFFGSGMSRNAIGACVILVVLILLERYFYNALVFGSILLAGLAWLGSPFTSFIGALGMAAIAAISPRPEGRRWQSAAVGIILISSVIVWITKEDFQLSILASHWWAIIICLISSLFGWTFGTNVYLVPLAMPWFGMGIILDGNPLFGLYLGIAIILRIVLNAYSPKGNRNRL